jgi:hypothetical protein
MWFIIMIISAFSIVKNGFFFLFLQYLIRLELVKIVVFYLWINNIRN